MGSFKLSHPLGGNNEQYGLVKKGPWMPLPQPSPAQDCKLQIIFLFLYVQV